MKEHGLIPFSADSIAGSNLNFVSPIEKSKSAAGFPIVRFEKVDSPFDDRFAVPLKNLTDAVSEF